VRITELDREVASLEARREPQQAELSGRRAAAADAEQARTDAESRLASDHEAYQVAAREIEGLEAEVESCRRDVFGALNQLTALQHAIDNALNVLAGRPATIVTATG